MKTESGEDTQSSAMTEPIDQATKLLSCPFCGTEPEWINEALPDSHYYIRCPHCQFVMKEDRRDKVIGFWNNRTELASLREQLANERGEFKNVRADFLEMNKRLMDDILKYKEQLKQKEDEIVRLKRAIELYKESLGIKD